MAKDLTFRPEVTCRRMRDVLAAMIRKLAQVMAILTAACMPSQAESLEQVVRQVLIEHPNARSSQALLQAAGERVYQARSNFYPSAGVEILGSEAKDRDFVGTNDRSTRRADAFLRWNLFRGQTDSYSLRAAEQDNLAAAEELADVHENVALQVTAAYLEVLRLRQRLALAQAQLDDYARLAADVRKRIAAGKAAAADGDQVRMAQIDSEWQVAQLQGQLSGAMQRYQLLVGRIPGDLKDPGLDVRASQVRRDDMMEQVLAGNRRVRATLARAAARAEEVGAVAGALYPSLSLEFRTNLYADIEPDPVTYTQSDNRIQLNYEVPLGGANYSRKREALARREAAQAAADAALLEVRTSLGEIWNAWEEARRMGSSLAERAHASGKVVAAYDLQFDAGRRTLQDLISIRGESFRARADVVDNRSEQLLGASQILNLLGQLRESLFQKAP